MFVPPVLLNAFGVRIAGGVQFVLTALLLIVVIVVVALATPAVDPARFEPLLPHGWPGVGAAIVLFVWAFAGWEVGTHISGEFRHPARDIPLATGIALVVTGACYLVLQVVTIGALGAEAGAGAVPLLDPARLGSDRWGPVAVGGIPRPGLALTAGIVAVYFVLMVVTGLEPTPFILVHTSSMVAIYVLGMIAAVRLLPTLSAGWWLAVVAAVLCAGLLLLAWQSLLPAAALAVVAVLVTVVRRRRAAA